MATVPPACQQIADDLADVLADIENYSPEDEYAQKGYYARLRRETDRLRRALDQCVANPPQPEDPATVTVPGVPTEDPCLNDCKDTFEPRLEEIRTRLHALVDEFQGAILDENEPIGSKAYYGAQIREAREELRSAQRELGGCFDVCGWPTINIDGSCFVSFQVGDGWYFADEPCQVRFEGSRAGRGASRSIWMTVPCSFNKKQSFEYQGKTVTLSFSLSIGRTDGYFDNSGPGFILQATSVTFGGLTQIDGDAYQDDGTASLRLVFSQLDFAGGDFRAEGKGRLQSDQEGSVVNGQTVTLIVRGSAPLNAFL
jgi:hypothetical protein